MEPILPEPAPLRPINSSPESNSSAPEMPAYSPEATPNQAGEKNGELPPTPPATPLAVAVNPAVTPAQPMPAADDNSAPTDDPLIADDVDVIEKEWVDKAKKIVNATREDPHTQEKEVSKLQADYLMKRYNKQLKLSE